MAVVPTPMNNETQLNSRFLEWWEKLSFFLERFNLIPVAVVVSVYHYYQALKMHDPFFVALPIAIFLDILHYRTVQQAARTRNFWWALSGVISTAMVFTMQFIFYSHEGTAVDGVTTSTQVGEIWVTVVFASIVPIGIVIMAILHETGLVDVATRLQLVIDGLTDRVTDLQHSERQLKQTVSKLEQDNTTLKHQVRELKSVETTLGAKDKALERLDGVVQELNDKLKQANKLIADQEEVVKLVDGVHPIVFHAMQVVNGRSQYTQQELAEMHNWSTSKVSRLVNLLRLDTDDD